MVTRWVPCCFVILVATGACERAADKAPANAADSSTAAGRLPYAEGFVSVAGNVRVYYRSYGTGAESIVFLHGGPGLSFMGIGPDLLPLALQRRLIMYDQRGGGRSDADPNAQAITPQVLVEDLEALRQQLHLDGMTLLGQSWGGLLAVHYASRYSEHVARLVLIGPMEPTARLFRQRLAAEAASDPAGERELALLSTALTQGGGDPIATCRAQDSIFNRRYYHDLGKAVQRRGDYCDVPADAPARGEVIYGAVSQSLGEYDLRASAAQLKVPVLIVEGAQTIIPPEGSREWARSFPDARLWLIERAGHGYPFVEGAEVFFPGLQHFLEGGWPNEATVVRR